MAGGPSVRVGEGRAEAGRDHRAGGQALPWAQHLRPARPRGLPGEAREVALRYKACVERGGDKAVCARSVAGDQAPLGGLEAAPRKRSRGRSILEQGLKSAGGAVLTKIVLWGIGFIVLQAMRKAAPGTLPSQAVELVKNIASPPPFLAHAAGVPQASA